jgi:Immunity protein 52
MNDLYIGAYWLARKETIQGCADRLGRCLTALSACSSVFCAWHKRGKSRRQTERVEIDFKNKDSLLELLEGGRNRKDIGKEVIEALGFQVGMWNGGPPQIEAGLSVTCGLYSTAPGLGGNCVVIDLPEELGELRQSGLMANVLAAVATSWEPDWAGVISRKSRETRSFVPGKPFVDWMLYVSSRLIPNPIVSEPSSVTPVDTVGSVIIVQQEPVKADSPADLQTVKAVETALGMTG